MVVLVLAALGFAVLFASSAAWAQAANFYNEPYAVSIVQSGPDTL